MDGVWAARLELRPKPQTEEYARGFRGAYTTVLVRCGTAEQFITAASEHVGREGFEIAKVETLSPLGSGLFEINDTLADLAERTRDYPVQWTTFHLFMGDA